MKDALDAVTGARGGGWVGDAAAQELDRRPTADRSDLEVSEIGLSSRREVIENPDPITACDKRGRDVRSDEACAAVTR